MRMSSGLHMTVCQKGKGVVREGSGGLTGVGHCSGGRVVLTVDWQSSTTCWSAPTRKEDAAGAKGIQRRGSE